MFFAGIDVGSLTAEAVIVDDNKMEIVHAQSMNVLPNPVDSAKEVMRRVLKKLDLSWDSLAYTVSTGYGREKIEKKKLAGENISEISCHGYGAFCACPDIRTVIDIGGQDAKVIKLNAKGDLVDFAMNDKCAAGTGHFLEIMSKALGVGLDEIGPISLGSKKPVEMSNRCSIYVETEVIHYIQRGVSKIDLAAGINRAMAERVFALVRRIGPEDSLMMTGGVAKNVAVRSELEKMLKKRMVVPKIDPQIIGAYGAEMLAAKSGGAK